MISDTYNLPPIDLSLKIPASFLSYLKTLYFVLFYSTISVGSYHFIHYHHLYFMFLKLFIGNNARFIQSFKGC